MKITYEIKNGENAKVKTYADGSVYKYDKNGNNIYYKHSDGYEKWREYDTNGNVIHYKDSNGDETWSEYNSNGRKIYFKNKIGYEKCIERTIANIHKYEITGEYIKECNSEV